MLVPKNNKNNQHPLNKTVPSDGRDVEFSAELADHDDLEAQARSVAAYQRQKNHKIN